LLSVTRTGIAGLVVAADGGGPLIWPTTVDNIQIYNKAITTQIFALNTSNGNLTAQTGNFVVGTSGKGIDFSATPGTGTSELLDDYEIGTWTPADNSGAGLTFTGVTATYTKVGRIVSAQMYLTYPSTASTASASITGLPYTSASGSGWSAGSVFTDAVSGKFAVVSQSSTNISFFNTADNSAATNVLFTGRFVILNFTYFV
jgi:hypothetical protein